MPHCHLCTVLALTISYRRKRTGRQPRAKNNACRTTQPKRDPEAEELVRKYNSFNGKTPEFILNQGIVVNID